MSANPNPTPPATTAETCVMGCKLPHGLQMRLVDKGGNVTIYVLKGNNASRIVGGYGLTEGVPIDFATEWLKRNSKHPAVSNGSIFVHTSVRDAEARAKEGRDLRTGIEPIDPIAHAKAHKLEPDADMVKAYTQAKRDNPARNRQIVE